MNVSHFDMSFGYDWFSLNTQMMFAIRFRVIYMFLCDWLVMDLVNPHRGNLWETAWTGEIFWPAAPQLRIWALFGSVPFLGHDNEAMSILLDFTMQEIEQLITRIPNPLILSVLSPPIGLNLALIASTLTMLSMFPLLSFLQRIIVESIYKELALMSRAPRKPLNKAHWTFWSKSNNLHHGEKCPTLWRVVCCAHNPRTLWERPPTISAPHWGWGAPSISNKMRNWVSQAIPELCWHKKCHFAS